MRSCRLANCAAHGELTRLRSASGASCCIAMHAAAYRVSGWHKVGCDRGVGVRRRRAAAARRVPPGARRGRGHRRHRRPARRSPTLYPNLAAAYGDQTVRGLGRRRRSTASTSCSWPCPTAQQPEARARAATAGWATSSTSAADFRLKDAACTRPGTARPTPAPELLADFVYGLPELFRPSIVAAPSSSPRPAATSTAAALALAPLVRAGLVETDRHRRRRRQRRVRRRATAKPNTPSAPSTRTSPPTACSTTGTRPRWSRRSAPSCSSRRTSRR